MFPNPDAFPILGSRLGMSSDCVARVGSETQGMGSLQPFLQN